MKIIVKSITYAVAVILAAGVPLAGAQQMQHQKGQQHMKKGRAAPAKLEKLYCTVGPEDRQARITVELLANRVQSIAYYSKWKPQTCSVHILRNDAYSRWEDTGSVTVVTLNEEKGAFLIDHERSFYKFLFRDVDRERFCGMEGKINGTLTVYRGRDKCEYEGVMDHPSDGK